MLISQHLFNEIMEKALKEYKENKDKQVHFIAQDVCEPYKHYFANNLDSYEDLIFSVTMNIVNSDR